MSRAFIHHRRRRPIAGAAIASLSASLLLVGGARAALSNFSLRFASKTPDAITAMHLYIVYRKPSDPNGKPSPIRHLLITAPRGTRIHLALPRCSANDQQIMADGPSACPADSEVGRGTLTATTGFGPPIDPFLTDVTMFNTGRGWVEVVQDPNTGATIADDRITIQGDVLTGNPPSIPGGPPDGQTAVRTIDFTLPASSRYITTPKSCSTGHWTSTATFTFADGTTEHLASTTPCKRPRHRHRPKPPHARRPHGRDGG